MKAWAKFNFKQSSEAEISNQIIWYNSCITIQGAPVFFDHAYRKGLIYVHQLFEHGTIISALTMFEKYQLTFLQYNAIVQAMPKRWKDYFKSYTVEQYTPLKPSEYDMCLNIKNLAQYIYKALLPTYQILGPKKNKWETETGKFLSVQQFVKDIKYVYTLTNIVKYRVFQYRLAQRSLVTNYLLEKWGIVNSNECSFCNTAEETVIHLLYGCPVVCELWKKIVEYVAQRFNGDCQITVYNVIFNRISDRNNLVNLLCLITKQYIYRQRCMKQPLVFEQVKQIFMCIQNTEKYIAIKNGNMSKHLKKWNKFNGNSTNNLNE